jgi:hypothetical protein
LTWLYDVDLDSATYSCPCVQTGALNQSKAAKLTALDYCWLSLQMQGIGEIANIPFGSSYPWTKSGKGFVEWMQCCLIWHAGDDESCSIAWTIGWIKVVQ